MKLDKFNEICREKWEDGHGDVGELYLTETSFGELYEDILTNRSGPVSLVHPDWHILNPVTRTLVKVHIFKGPKDLMLVHYGMWKKSEKAEVDV